MKIYKFYLVKKFINPAKYPAISDANIFETRDGKYSCLYGYTNDKLIRDEFIEYRNMNIFKMKKYDIDETEYEDFVEAYPDEELQYSSFGTNTVINGNTKIAPIQLITTKKESETVFLDYDMVAEGSLYNIFNTISNGNTLESFFNSVHNFSNMFKHDITEALEYLNFENIMYEYFGVEDDPLPFKVFEEDKLMVYCKLFGNTYKEGML